MDAIVKRIAMIAFDDADLFDIAGPDKVFHSAARFLVHLGVADRHLYRIDLFSPDGGLTRTLQEIRIETLAMRELATGEYDTIIVVGGIDRACRDPRVIGWLQRNHRKARRVSSVCMGAFALAEAGLLDGRRAATHWMDCDALQAGYPAIEVDRDSIFVEDRGVWTSAGMTAGIDMALAMVEEDHDRELALLVARSLVVFLQRSGGQSQFSKELVSQTVEGPIAPLLRWIIEHPGDDLRAEVLAERVHMSLRSFYRAFEGATGKSPAEWVETIRLEIAKRLLERTGQRVDQIAWQAGFANYERMRRAFIRRIGVAPAAYRARFSRPPLHQTEIDPTLVVEALDGEGAYRGPLQ